MWSVPRTAATVILLKTARPAPVFSYRQVNLQTIGLGLTSGPKARPRTGMDAGFEGQIFMESGLLGSFRPAAPGRAVSWTVQKRHGVPTIHAGLGGSAAVYVTS